MILKFNNFIKTSLTALFRYAFGHTSTPVEYKYDRDSKLTKIAIYRGFPRRVELYPCLIIEAEASDASMTFLGEEELGELRNDDGSLASVKYGGPITIPIKVTVQARTVTDMERITDLCAIYLRYLFRNKFASHGFAYTKIKIGSDSQATVDNEPLFSKTITIDMYTEFESTIDGSLFTDIEKINLDIVISTFEITP
jgi:hypothetical protein